MPRPRATERRDSAAAPSRATWSRATARISLVIASRTRSRAVRGAEVVTAPSLTVPKREHKYLTRTLFTFRINVHDEYPQQPHRGGLEPHGHRPRHRPLQGTGLVHAQRLQPRRGGPHPARRERARLPRARTPRPQDG